MGYYKAGFEVTGVDVSPQSTYPFEFVQDDAFAYLKLNGHKFDVIHASPPCQGYSNLTPIKNRASHVKLIVQVREALLGYKYVIENVAGAKADLINPLMLCGSMFGLLCYRHRFFESSISIQAPAGCNHNFIPLLVTTASVASRKLRQKIGIPPKTVLNAPQAYGIDWMKFSGLKEAIPPAYTEYIGKQLIEVLEKEAVERRLTKQGVSTVK